MRHLSSRECTQMNTNKPEINSHFLYSFSAIAFLCPHSFSDLCSCFPKMETSHARDLEYRA